MKRIIIIMSFVILSIWTLHTQNGWCENVRYAYIKDIKGQVEVKKASDNQWVIAKIGMVLLVNDEIRTNIKSRVKLLLDKGGATAQLYIKEATRLKIDTLDLNPQTGEKKTLLDVAIGRVLVHVAKLKGNSKFEINTPTSTMGVRGTTFEVVVQEKEKK